MWLVNLTIVTHTHTHTLITQERKVVAGPNSTTMIKLISQNVIKNNVLIPKQNQFSFFIIYF